MQRRHNKCNDSDGLMGKSERNRYVPEEREDTKRRLHQQHARERDRAGAAMVVIRAIGGMQDRKSQEQVRNHAMGELHRKMIVQQIHPDRMEGQQVRAWRDECAIDQRPRIVDKTCLEPGHHTAEGDLRHK